MKQNISMQENQFWNQLEAYLRDHREELDVDEPHADVWDRVAKQLSSPVRPLWQQTSLWRAAAVIAVAFGLVYWWYVRLDNGLPSVGADISHDKQQGQATWDTAKSPYQAEIDSLEAVAGPKTDAMPALQAVQARIDSLEAVGAPTQANIGLRTQWQQEQVEMLRAATQE